MLKRMPLKSLFAFLIVGFTMAPAMASSVTYNLSATDGLQLFTGLFSFDTITHAISNESLQSSGGYVDNWVATAQPYSYYGGNIGAPPNSWDLFFSSASANFPASPGDLVGLEFDNPLDGVSADGIFGVEDFTYNYPPSPAPFIADGFIQGCVTPGPACSAATPLPAALSLFATGLGALGLLGWRRKRKNAAIAA
jgi:hypothetical protein